MKRNKEKLKAAKHRYYEKHKDEILRKQKEHYERNKEVVLERQRKYNEEHKEERAAARRIYSDNHKSEKSEYDKKRYEEKKEEIKQRTRDRANSLAKYDSFAKKFEKYCEIQRDPDNPELIHVRCKYCNKWFNPTVRQLDDRYDSIIGRTTAGNELYCSDACKKACPIFGQILYPKDFKQNTSREVQPELRKMVLERDKWTCQKCGKSKDEIPELELHCHHIFPLNEDPIRSADMDNCETLCKECHQWKHQNIPGCSYKELKC